MSPSPESPAAPAGAEICPPESGEPAQGRLRLGAILSVAALVLVAFVGSTWAAFVDIEAGSFDVDVQAPRLWPAPSRLGATAMGIDDQGRAVIWGERSEGISGTGVTKVDENASASVVALPEGRAIVILTGGSQDGYYASSETFVVALDDRGQVWTWGFGSDNFFGGRTPDTTYPVSKPGPVAIPERVVDIQATSETTYALTVSGAVYSWGDDYHDATGQGAKAGEAAVARRILTGIHSIGATHWSAWAVAAPGWTSITYDNKESATVGSQSAPNAKGGLLFWGFQSTGSGGGASGDGRSTGNYAVPTLVADSSPLSLALVAGAAAGDDNVSLGVRAGSAQDQGTFQQMTGSYWGCQFRLRDGSLFLWGYSTEYNSGTDVTMAGTISSYVPQRVTLSAPVVQVAHTEDIILLLDSTGTAWLYGNRVRSRNYPDATGAPVPATGADVRLPMRIDGGASYPGWAAGSIADIACFGYSTALLHKDGSVWLVGGGVQGAGGNGRHIVRNYLDTRNTVPSTPAQPLTRLNF
ncbi:MAG: hypothetical protein LBJ44_11945 [Propionibacteriaceae bacterium]|jgi:hypothetical protein|nr:hypothetical protein [Propionibacteriaceae bacterium]